ncbi:DUF2235 domain-containing protein [Kushneria sp. Sum13]|uniref:DUF2235 domain-containing protein n=1 Tax=Kushneria sp. Sum13 TaxID=3459196 RepID=UPI004046278D
MGKNLVVCCDGTNQQFSRVNTNVVHLFRLIKRHGDQQKAFYSPGVGTFAAPFFGIDVGRALGRALGTAFGYGIQQNMEDAYRFLMNEYEPGDRVFLFGFSRGAFTARSLASMIDRCGILYPHHDNMVQEITRRYLRGDDATSLRTFRDTFARSCKPWLVGVWDTVGALGCLISMRKFHNRRLSPGVRFAYHALALDEKRRPFSPTPWDESKARDGQHIEQRWFAGSHGDVGGMYRERGLSDITLRWMLERATEHGLLLEQDDLSRIQGDPAGMLHQKASGPWRLLGTRRRHYPCGALIDESVQTRIEQVDGYQPAARQQARE